MSDEQTRMNLNERPEQAKPQQTSQNVQQDRADALDKQDQPDQQAARGRMPLFRR